MTTLIWKCVRDFHMKDPEEPIPFVAGKEYRGEHLFNDVHEDGREIAVFKMTNEQGEVHCMEDSDLNSFFVRVREEKKDEN